MTKLIKIAILTLVLGLSVIGQTTVKTVSNRLEGSRSFIATAYCQGTHTATGERVRSGLVAADPRVLPFGSILFIDGYGTYKVSDTGGLIKNNRLDIYMPSCAKAIKFGRKTVQVKVISLGKGKKK